MTEIEKTEGEIKVLQAKLELLKEMEKHKTPCEEAYKRVYGFYPETYEDSWSAFQDGYIASQKDYKVGEFQHLNEELLKSKEKEMIKRNLKTSLQELANGDVRPIYDVVRETKNQQVKELVREGVKWCEEHPNESVEDYLTPRGPQGPVGPGPGPKGVIVGYEPTPQTPEQVADGLKEAFRESVKQGVVSSTTKAQNLYDIICDCMVKYNSTVYPGLICDILDAVDEWLPKEQSAAGSQNAYVECSVEGFNDAINKIKGKLR